MTISGGDSHHSHGSRGGDVMVHGGKSLGRNGGAIWLTSGKSKRRNSGKIGISSGNGLSSGDVELATGKSEEGGASGNVNVNVGMSESANGGNVNLFAGKSGARSGGSINAIAGSSRDASDAAATHHAHRHTGGVARKPGCQSMATS